MKSFLIKASAHNNTINRTAYVCFEKYQWVCEYTKSKNYAFVMINEAKILYQINSIDESNVINLWFISANELKHRITF